MLVASALGTMLVPSRAFAANSSTPGSISVQPAFHSAGLRVPITGDDNGNATIAVSYRKVGSDTTLSGHGPRRIPGGRAATSLFHLQPDTAYEVSLTLNDPDNAFALTTSTTFRTRADFPPAPKGGALYVNAKTGNDSNTGSQSSPFKTIQRAADAASAGVTVHVAAGVYREMVAVRSGHGGTQGNPVWFVADEGAVVDGSDPALENGTAFQSDGAGIWSAPFQGSSAYVAVDDARLYDYASLTALQNGTSGISGGFFVDKAAGRIRVKLPSGDSPASHKIHVARFPTAFMLDSVTDVVLEGFEIRYFGAAMYNPTGVAVRNTSRAWIRKNDIHHMNAGVILYNGGSDNVVELNTIHDTSVWEWPWDAVKNHTPEATAISVSGGAGTVVRRNTTHGNFNGIYVGSFDDSSETIGADADIYENTMFEHGDDGFEPEGACVNVRFRNNAIHGMHNGISLSPIEVGPLWVVRNLLDGYKANALKVNNGPTGWMLVYHNTAVPITTASQAMSPTLAFRNLITRNNIFAAHRYIIESGVTPSGQVDLDYDNVYTDSLDGTPRFVKWANVRYSTLTELKASNTIEKHGWSVAPKYENAAAGDFTLVEGSPLIDVGAVIPGINDQGSAGSGPDVGAFERGAVVPDSDAGAPDGTGGSAGAGSGGAAGAGGATSVGGAAGAGGDANLGGAPGAGGNGNPGGAPGAGGDSAAGGGSGAGGESGTGGAPPTGGAAGVGGTTGSDAGASGGSGGASGSPNGNGGAATSAGGTAGAASQGGGATGGAGREPSPSVIDEEPDDGGDGVGCSTSPAKSSGALPLVALASVALLRRRRRQ